jgi:hypothetical protein
MHRDAKQEFLVHTNTAPWLTSDLGSRHSPLTKDYPFEALDRPCVSESQQSDLWDWICTRRVGSLLAQDSVSLTGRAWIRPATVEQGLGAWKLLPRADVTKYCD